MQTPKTSLETHDMELGLKALTLCTSENNQKHHNSCVMTSNLLSPPPSPSFSSQIGDYIGMESCLDLKNYEDLHTANREDQDEGTHVQNYRVQRVQRWPMKKKEFPPPISMLARTENQPSHMPFVLKRYYTNDGRLILREERVRHHEYFRAYRSNGHLTLQLVPLDDDVLAASFDDENETDEQYCKDEEGEEEEEETAAAETETEDANENGDSVYDVDNYNNVEKENIIRKDNEYESKIAESSVENGSVGICGSGGGGKCLNYNSVRISSSRFLGMSVPAIKPVHT